MRVAVIGASGIGKHHAKWYALEGGEVVACVGTSSESVARTCQELHSLFGFSGRGYCNLEEMLHQARPQAVSVCSPHPLHHAHALLSLSHGAHVLCEKPLVWHESGDADLMARQAQELLHCAESTCCLLAVNTQYVAALETYEQIYRTERGRWDPVQSVFMQMESLGGRRGPHTYEDIWVDLGSHPLSLLLRWLPEGELDPNTVSCRIGEHEVCARFTYGGASVDIAVRHLSAGLPKRRFGVNGLLVEVEGRPDEDGVFRTFLCRAGREVKLQDLVHTSLQRFLQAAQGRGQVLATAHEAYRNLALQCAILSRARRV